MIKLRISNRTSETHAVAWKIFLSAWHKATNNGRKEDPYCRNVNKQHQIKTHLAHQYEVGALSTSQARRIGRPRPTNRMRQTPRNARHRNTSQSPSALYRRIAPRVDNLTSATHLNAYQISLSAWRRATNNGCKEAP